MSIDQIGMNIVALRKNRRLMQEELAKSMGVSTQSVSKWENSGVGVYDESVDMKGGDCGREDV